MPVVFRYCSSTALTILAVGLLGSAFADGTNAGKANAKVDPGSAVSDGEASQAIAGKEKPAAGQTSAGGQQTEDTSGPRFQGLALLSEGKPNYGVRIPNFTGDALVSLTDMEKLTKLPNGNLLIENMVFTKYDEAEKISMIVEVELGIYNTKDERLTSTHQTVIRGDGFYAVGEGCVFRQGSSIVELTGVVNSRFADELVAVKVTGNTDPSSEHEDEKPAETE